MRRLIFCALGLSLLGLATGCRLLGGHVAGVCDCGEAPVQPIIQPYGISSGPTTTPEAAKQMPTAPEEKKSE
jgi:hypothetical protein